MHSEFEVPEELAHVHLYSRISVKYGGFVTVVYSFDDKYVILSKGGEAWCSFQITYLTLPPLTNPSPTLCGISGTLFHKSSYI